ncbi:MAG: ABC transporter ATP-binding protein, partial [Tepidisphaeraceae bacterium]
MTAPATNSPALSIRQVAHHYGDRHALNGISFDVARGEIFGLLGPNGSGKSTLFKLLSTLMPLQTGQVTIDGLDLATRAPAIRQAVGVVFQHPALDKQLTVEENLRFHGKLFGLSIRDIKRRTAELLARFNLADRAHELVASLSGGMRRKVELAKAILATPKLLLLDEPSTGLDVAARIELWQLLRELRQAGDLTILLTTHLMDEADRCDHLAIIDQGNLLVVDTPDALKDALGGDVITFVGRDLPQLQSVIQQKLGIVPQLIEDRLRIERPQAHLFVPQLIEAAPGLIDSISVGRPTLDDVFVHRTGRRLHTAALPT